MTLPDLVPSPDGHIAGHNNERHLINGIQTITDGVFSANLDAAITERVDTGIAESVPDAVVDALTDPGITTIVTDAVDEVIADLDLPAFSPNEDEAVYSLRVQNQMDPEDFTDPVKFTEGEGIIEGVSYKALDMPSGEVQPIDSGDSKYIWSIEFEDPITHVRRVQLGVRLDGTVYASSLEQQRLPSGPDIVGDGMSLLAGAGGGGVSPMSALATLMTAGGKPGVVRNNSVGGERSYDIACRAGGNPLLLTPVGGSIPASGSVNITLKSTDGDATGTFIKQGTSGLNPCTLITGDGAEILGTVAWDGTNYTFTRSSAGSVITVTAPLPILANYKTTRLKDIHVIWAGRNNLAQTDRVLADIQSIILNQNAADPLYLILGELNGDGENQASGTYANIATITAAEKKLYGRRFIDIRRYLIDYGLADAGITPTTQDLADIANDIVPTSLRSDNIHLNGTGYALVGKRIYIRLIELKWI